MIITEREIFNFVFEPASLNPDKLLYIKRNYTRFKDQIELCKSVFENQDSDIKINKEKINFLAGNSSVCKNTILDLIEVESFSSPTQDISKYAAASNNDSTDLVVRTFKEPNSNIFAKILSTKAEKKLYVFGNNMEELKNIQVIFNKESDNPSEIILESNQAPLDLDIETKIDTISVKF